MGMTISFKGSLDDCGKIKNLTDEISDICEVMNWEYQVFDDDWSAPIDGKIVREKDQINIEGNLGLKGVGFQPHNSCEWVELYFDDKGRITSPVSQALHSHSRSEENKDGWNNVKTQFAPINTHIAIIKLLRHLKKHYVKNLEVVDEGEYWESNNLEKLSSHRDSITQAMDVVQKTLETTHPEYQEQMSSEEYADYIATLLENRFLEDEIKSLGGSMSESKIDEPYINNQFMKNILAFEEAEKAPQIPMRSLFPGDFEFPPAESMSEQEISDKLDAINDIFSSHNIEFGFAEELPDKLLYKHLVEDCIPNDMVDSSTSAGFTCVLDGCNGDCESCFQKEYCDTGRELDDIPS